MPVSDQEVEARLILPWWSHELAETSLGPEMAGRCTDGFAVQREHAAEESCADDRRSNYAGAGNRGKHGHLHPAVWIGAAQFAGGEPVATRKRGVASKGFPTEQDGKFMPYKMFRAFDQEQTSFRELLIWGGTEALIRDRDGAEQGYFAAPISGNACCWRISLAWWHCC